MTAFVVVGVEASHAEDQVPEGSLEQIVVTAQKRTQNLQDVPIVIDAISGTTATALGIQDTTDLAMVTPGLNMHHQSNVLAPSLRGISQTSSASGDESPIAVYVDGVYYASMAGGLFSLNNIERIEVLKGPQGTLFGRNAAGGVIQIITERPQQDPYTDVSVGYANYDTYESKLYATAGITRNLATDVAVYWHHQYDGWGRNVTTGAEAYTNDEVAIRNKWLLDISDSTHVLFSGDYDRGIDPIGVARSPLPGTILGIGEPHLGGFYDLQENVASYNINKQWGGSIRVDQDIPWAKLVSISAYRAGTPFTVFDQDAGSRNFVTLSDAYRTRELTQELQLLSNDSSKIKWIFGFFYLNNRSNSDLIQTGTSVAPPVTSRSTIVTIYADSVAGFAETTVPVFSDSTQLTAGLRYTADKQHIVGATYTNLGQVANSSADQQKDFDKLTWRFSLDHKFTSDFMAYISYNRGFKSGVFNATSPKDPAVDPSVIDAYETGMKSEWLNGKLRLNGSVYYYNYDGVQLSVPILGASRLLNAAQAKVKGSDLDFEYVPLNRLTLRTGISYTDARYRTFPVAPYVVAKPAGGYRVVPGDGSGNEMIYTPQWTASASAQYTVPTTYGNFGAALNYYYSGGFYADSPNQFFQPAYQLVNASLDWTQCNNKCTFRLWGKNLNDAHYYNHFSISSQGAVISPGEPRTYGISLDYKFGGR
jgi:iron complex outermembrane receptor protein